MVYCKNIIKKLFIGLIILGTYSGTVFALSVPDRIELKTIIKNQDYKAAEQKLLQIVESTPNDLEALNYLATIYSWDNQFELAKTYFQKVIDQNTNDLEANLGLAKVYSWQGNFSHALNILKSIEPFYPNNTDILLLKGKISRWNQELQPAQAYLNRGLEIDPKNFDLLFELGLTYLDQQDFQNALLIFRNLNFLYPNNPQVLTNLKIANLALKPKINIFYSYLDNFDLDYLKNNQNKKVRQNKYNIGIEQNIFSKMNLAINYNVGPQVGYDVISNTTDYEVNGENLNLKLKYSFTDLFDLSLGGEAIRFSNIETTSSPLAARQTNLNAIAAITKKTNTYRADVYYYGEYFPLVRGSQTQIFNTKTYGLSYFTKLSPSFGVGLCFENTYYSSFNDFRQHYIGWIETTIFPDTAANFNFQYQFKYYSNPKEYYDIFYLNKVFTLSNNLFITPGLMFTLNSLKYNCQSKVLLDVNYQTSDYLAFYLTTYYGTENLSNQIIPSMAFKFGLNYLIN